MPRDLWPLGDFLWKIDSVVMHVLLTIPNLLKSSGGPTAVVQCLSEQLALSGVSVSVLTTKPDFGQPEALPRDPRIRLIHAPAKEPGSWGGGYRHALADLLKKQDIDVVHDFGLWQPTNHASASECRKAGIPYVSSTSGMLAPWALRHKAWKKKFAWWLYQRKDLAGATILAATSAQEVRDVRHKVPGKDIALIPNGVEIPVLPSHSVSHPGKRVRKVVFLGRIHSVKGLKNLIEAWSLVNPENWRCILAGPDEAGHQKELTDLLRERKMQDKFEFPGLVEGDAKWLLLRGGDLFVLPSFTENFGISAAEALASGVPVITTKGTPWKDIVEQQCGWWVDVGVEPLAKALREATALSDEKRHEMGIRGRMMMEDNFSWNHIARKTSAVYSWILGLGPKPDCVI